MRHRSLTLLVCLALAGTAAQAQSADDDLDRKVAERFEAARAKFGVGGRRQRCQPAEAGEIVVCGNDTPDQRVPSTAETDPNSRAARRALDGNIPSAPQFDHGYCAKCPHFGRVPPPVYYVDIKALPEAPEGSDADKIAKGEAPAP